MRPRGCPTGVSDAGPRKVWQSRGEETQQVLLSSRFNYDSEEPAAMAHYPQTVTGRRRPAQANTPSCWAAITGFLAPAGESNCQRSLPPPALAPERFTRTTWQGRGPLACITCLAPPLRQPLQHEDGSNAAAYAAPRSAKAQPRGRGMEELSGLTDSLLSRNSSSCAGKDRQPIVVRLDEVKCPLPISSLSPSLLARHTRNSRGRN